MSVSVIFQFLVLSAEPNLWNEYFIERGRKVSGKYGAAWIGLALDRLFEEYKKGNTSIALGLSYKLILAAADLSRGATPVAKRYAYLVRDIAFIMFVSIWLNKNDLPFSKEFVNSLFEYLQHKALKSRNSAEQSLQILGILEMYLDKDYRSSFNLIEKFFTDLFSNREILSWYRAKFYRHFYLYWLSELALKAGYEDKFRYYLIEYLSSSGVRGLVWVVNPGSHPLLESPFVALGEYGGLKNAGKILGAIWRSGFGFLRKLEFTLFYLIVGFWYSFGVWLILMSLLVIGLAVGVMLLWRRKKGTGVVSEGFSVQDQVR